MFNIGDKVMINPNATKEDFEEYSCTTDFLNFKNDIFEITDKNEHKTFTVYRTKCLNKDKEQKYKFNRWWMLEQCLTLAKEENEL